ncbi:MAG: DUF6249 domain-containing protein, partial [Thermoanaerobaculia bacterium]|nr:DUF6249 domain-containing protein [Thermoanaerobaculia bacterium]
RREDPVMTQEFFFPLLVAAFVLAAWGLVIVGRHLRDSNRIRAREILHKERVLAMERDAPLPPLPEPLSFDERAGADMSGQVLVWFRIVALCIGFFLLFCGIGMTIAFSLEESFEEVSTVGWIPTFAGIGLLLFYRLSRGLASELDLDRSA